ncbi:MAG: hypothetical protein GXO60_07135 [Epsilonproteobacteria bacterium]|nr:hypothetical protein [Campylobacterota bacterium]
MVTDKRFIEENGTLYLIEVNRDYFNRALESALKIAGVRHVLALLMAKNQKEYFKHQSNLKNNNFKRNPMEYLDLFEKVIEKFGIHVGNVIENSKSISWLYNPLVGIKLETLRQTYSKSPEKFYILGNKLFFLAPLQHFVEKMFIESINVAGSENALAKALASTPSEEKKFRMAFKRMSFRHTKTFVYYSHLFAEYLQKNRPLFTEYDYDKTA